MAMRLVLLAILLSPSTDYTSNEREKTMENVRQMTVGAPLPEPSTPPIPLTPAAALQELAPTGTPPWKLIQIQQSDQAIETLTQLLGSAYAVQRTFGEKAESFELRDAIFQQMLAEYPLWRVEKAFFDFMRSHPDLPTPSDIIKPIEEDLKDLRIRRKYASS